MAKKRDGDRETEWAVCSAAGCREPGECYTDQLDAGQTLRCGFCGSPLVRVPGPDAEPVPSKPTRTRRRPTGTGAVGS